MKRFFAKKPIIFSLLVILAVACVVLIPIFQKGFPISDDGEWMVIRLSAFFQTFREGQFPVRFLGRLNNSYGYPVANFLYPGFLYLGSLIHAIGASFSQSVEFIIAGSVFLSALFLFFLLKRHFDAIPATAATVSYLLSPYLLYDIYKRGSVGELAAIAMGLACFFCLTKKLRLFLPITVFFLLVSHNTLAVFFIMLLAVYIIIKREFSFFVPMGIGIIMSSFFWIPALWELQFVSFSQIAVSNPFAYFGESHTLLFWSAPWIIAAGLAAAKKIPQQENERNYFLIVFALGVFFSSILSGFLWTSKTLTDIVQFPFRFQTLLLLSGPWITAFLLQGKKPRMQLFISLVIVVYFGIFGFQRMQSVKSVVREEGYFTTNEGTTTVLSEYLPKWITNIPQYRSAKRLEFFKGKGEILKGTVTTQKIDVTLVTQENSVVQINTIFYPGWGATLDNKPVQIDYDNPSGFMRIPVPKGEHRLFVEFRETIARFAADSLTLFGCVLYALYGVRYIGKNKKR